MNRTYLILGGARSGKTRRALSLGEHAQRKIYIATAEGRDEEMRGRIARHRADRSAAWETVEETADLARAIALHDKPESVLVIDCITLWLSNLMERGLSADEETARLLEIIPKTRGMLIIVSNELGLGLVPETALGRSFRDVQGRANQALASAVDCVEFMVAGLPLAVKGKTQ